MIEENTDMRDEIKAKEEKWEEQKEEIEKKHKNMETQYKIKQVDLEKQVLDVTAERNETKRELDKERNDFANRPEDPEKIALREEVALKDQQIEAGQVALKTFVQEQSKYEGIVERTAEPLEKKIVELENVNKVSEKVIEKL